MCILYNIEKQKLSHSSKQIKKQCQKNPFPCVTALLSIPYLLGNSKGDQAGTQRDPLLFIYTKLLIRKWPLRSC